MIKMETKQCQLISINFTSSTSCVPRSIFKDNFPEKELDEKKPKIFTWKIDNKYFTADISVCLCSEKALDNINLEELTEIEAVLLICNANDDVSLIKAKNIVSSLEKKDPEICLLYSTEEVKDAKSKDDIFAFCIDNHFEFVEAVDICENVDEDEDDGEKYGVERLIEALNSHVWNGHLMKGEHDLIKDISDQNIDDGYSEVPDGDESFEELFSKFLSMKEKAKTLGEEERRAYAEKVSLAFMDALGIEEDEDCEEISS